MMPSSVERAIVGTQRRRSHKACSWVRALAEVAGSCKYHLPTERILSRPANPYKNSPWIHRNERLSANRPPAGLGPRSARGGAALDEERESAFMRCLRRSECVRTLVTVAFAACRYTGPCAICSDPRRDAQPVVSRSVRPVGDRKSRLFPQNHSSGAMSALEGFRRRPQHRALVARAPRAHRRGRLHAEAGRADNRALFAHGLRDIRCD